MIKDCRARKDGHHKKFEKAERGIDGDDGPVRVKKKIERKTFGLQKM